MAIRSMAAGCREPPCASGTVARFSPDIDFQSLCHRFWLHSGRAIRQHRSRCFDPDSERAAIPAGACHRQPAMQLSRCEYNQEMQGSIAASPIGRAPGVARSSERAAGQCFEHAKRRALRMCLSRHGQVESLLQQILPAVSGMQHLIRKDHPGAAGRKIERHLW